MSVLRVLTDDEKAFVVGYLTGTSGAMEEQQADLFIKFVALRLHGLKIPEPSTEDTARWKNALLLVLGREV